MPDHSALITKKYLYNVLRLLSLTLMNTSVGRWLDNTNVQKFTNAILERHAGFFLVVRLAEPMHVCAA